VYAAYFALTPMPALVHLINAIDLPFPLSHDPSEGDLRRHADRSAEREAGSEQALGGTAQHPTAAEQSRADQSRLARCTLEQRTVPTLSLAA